MHRATLHGETFTGTAASAAGTAAPARRAAPGSNGSRSQGAALRHPGGQPSAGGQTTAGAIATAVRACGLALVDVERAPGGLLRVTIDRPWQSGQAVHATVDVDDCERVTRQLQHVLEVEGVDYSRLEVSSPGLDRPLRDEADYARFAGEPVQLTLKAPFQGRKHWRGELQAGEGGGWRIVLPPPAPPRGRPGRPGKAGKAGKAGPKAAAGPAEVGTTAEVGATVLDFRLDEIREARLLPVIDFKGRRHAPDGGAAPAAGVPVTDGGPEV